MSVALGAFSTYVSKALLVRLPFVGWDGVVVGSRQRAGRDIRLSRKRFSTCVEVVNLDHLMGRWRFVYISYQLCCQVEFFLEVGIQYIY